MGYQGPTCQALEEDPEKATTVFTGRPAQQDCVPLGNVYTWVPGTLPPDPELGFQEQRCQKMGVGAAPPDSQSGVTAADTAAWTTRWGPRSARPGLCPAHAVVPPPPGHTGLCAWCVASWRWATHFTSLASVPPIIKRGQQYLPYPLIRLSGELKCKTVA